MGFREFFRFFRRRRAPTVHPARLTYQVDWHTITCLGLSHLIRRENGDEKRESRVVPCLKASFAVPPESTTSDRLRSASDGFRRPPKSSGD